MSMTVAGLAFHANAESPEAHKRGSVNRISLEEEIVITGTRTEKRLDDSPVAIDVIPSDIIERVSQGTLEQILQFIPGVYMSRSTKEGFNILMRGFDGDRVLVLVDGQRLVAPSGASVDFAQISALEIERIEVVRGAASALYGSEAMGGVINIITADHKGSRLRLTHATGQYEDNASGDTSAHSSISGSAIGEHWGAEALFQSMEDPAYASPQSEPAHLVGGPEELAAEQEKTLARAKLKFRSGNLKADYTLQQFDEEKYRLGGAFVNGKRDYYLSDVDRQSHSSAFSYKTLDIKAQNVQHEETSGYRGSLRFAEIGLTELDAQTIWNALDAEWVGGIHYYLDELNQYKIVEGTTEVDTKQGDGIESFIQGDWLLGDNWEFIAGARLQKDAGYGAHTALKANMKYSYSFLENHEMVWRTSFGEGYRVPTIKEQFYVFDHSNLGYKVLGNSNLAPEESWSFSSEVEYRLALRNFSQFSIGLTLHQSRAENFIDTVLNPDKSAEENLDISEYQNIDSTNITGADIDLALDTQQQRFGLSYNYLDARNKHTGNRLYQRPYHQLKANYQYTWPRVGFRWMTYAVVQKDQAYDPNLIEVNNTVATLNASFSHTFSPKFRWEAGVENITNDRRDSQFQQGIEFDPRTNTGRYLFFNIELKLE